jgi:hypothetical protein
MMEVLLILHQDSFFQDLHEVLPRAGDSTLCSVPIVAKHSHTSIRRRDCERSVKVLCHLAESRVGLHEIDNCKVLRIQIFRNRTGVELPSADKENGNRSNGIQGISCHLPCASRNDSSIWRLSTEATERVSF